MPAVKSERLGKGGLEGDEYMEDTLCFLGLSPIYPHPGNLNPQSIHRIAAYAMHA